MPDARQPREQDRPVTRVIVVTQNDPIRRTAEGNNARYGQQAVWDGVARHIARTEAAPNGGRTLVVHARSREHLEQTLRRIHQRQPTSVRQVDFVGHGTRGGTVLSVQPRRDLQVGDLGRTLRNGGVGRDGGPVTVRFRTCESGQGFVDQARRSIEAGGIRDVTVQGRSTEYLPRVQVDSAGRVRRVTDSPGTDVESRSAPARRPVAP